jgi:peptide/nickel transport system permease protein
MLNTSNTQFVSHGFWTLAWRRLRRDTLAMLSLGIIALFSVLLSLTAFGFIAADWDTEIALSYAPPHFLGADDNLAMELQSELTPPENPYDPLLEAIREIKLKQAHAANNNASFNPQARASTLIFGADKWGHDVVKKALKGAETSVLIGLLAAVVATVLGTLLGAIAGYCGGYVDDFLNWFYNIFTSIPYLLLVLAVAAVLQKTGVLSIVLILGLTGWTAPFRLIRAEYMKHRHREYVMAADAIGASALRKMFYHIFPNVSHVALVQISLLLVSFIKSEVILSFLGLGVPVGVVSWGSMLNEAQNELILGKWWQLAIATMGMALLVTATSLFTDALRDALDPQSKGA